ncbi:MULTISPECIES: hypothetical protein [Acidithiobacillus]|uniref:Uncharacterized protein n=1 Tax=Acidithiobacillus sulfurivorans TaxID=1958756 RepID=A0ABS6A3G5_9PROT|nr:hypothetical protein [Acidithiobacillus sulfurivorans]MBU2761721.1 hypothetical protein [Acidithiobacillus sulfurivorans]
MTANKRCILLHGLLGFYLSSVCVTGVAWAAPTTFGAGESSQVMAFAAGQTGRHTITFPWHPAYPVNPPQITVSGGPVGVRAQAMPPKHGLLPVRLTCPGSIAPGLYAVTLQTQEDGHTVAWPLTLAVEALYISMQANSGGTAGVLVESPTGHVLPQATAALSQQFTMTRSPWGTTYDPQNQALYIATEGHVPVDVTTTLGQPLPITFPPHTAGGSLSFADWMGGDRVAFSSIDGDPSIYSDNGAEIAANNTPGRFDFHWGGEQAQTANPETGTLFLSNDAVSTGLPMDEVQSYSNQGTPEQTWPVARAVVAMVFNPWNNLLYVLASHVTHTDQHFRVFHPDGTPAFAFPQIPGITEAPCPLGQKLAANPVNGHLYLLTQQRIWVLSPHGRVIRTLDSPPGANSIAFVPQTLLLPNQDADTIQPVPTSFNQNLPNTTTVVPATTIPSGCPPGYRCIPNPSATPEATQNVPSVNTAINRASNTIGNVGNLANNVSNLMNAFR